MIDNEMSAAPTSLFIICQLAFNWLFLSARGWLISHSIFLKMKTIEQQQSAKLGNEGQDIEIYKATPGAPTS